MRNTERNIRGYNCRTMYLEHSIFQAYDAK